MMVTYFYSAFVCTIFAITSLNWAVRESYIIGVRFWGGVYRRKKNIVFGLQTFSFFSWYQNYTNYMAAPQGPSPLSSADIKYLKILNPPKITSCRPALYSLKWGLETERSSDRIVCAWLCGRGTLGVQKGWRWPFNRGLQRDVVYLGWPIAPSYVSPNAGEEEEFRGLRQWVQLYIGDQMNFWDLTPYLTYNGDY